MLNRFMFRVVVAVVPLTLLVSACGVNLSGEPEIANEREIPAPTQLPTQPPPEAASAPDTDAAAAPTATAAPAERDDATPAAAGSVDLTAGDFDQGFELYLQECAQCHGADAGVGPSLADMHERAASGVEGMAGPDYIHQSIVDPGAVVAEGYENVMPTDYGQRLDEQQIASLVRFIVEFSPEAMMAGPGGAVATEAPSGTQAFPTPVTTPTETLTIRGRLIQGTSGGEQIPGGLTIELYALDMHGQLAGSYQTESAEDGTYVFENVARGASSSYLLSVNYADVTQGAQIPAIQGDEEELTKDITLYERTTDTANITITWAQLLVNYAPIDQFGLEVWERVEVANTGDRIVTTDEKAGPNDWYVSTTLELPAQAFGIQPMQAEGSNRYAVDVVDGVPIVRDTWPLRPGQVQTITLAYYLPYENGAVLDQSFSYPVMDATVLVPNDTVELRSDQLDAGEWRYRISEDGIHLTELAADDNINPDKDFALVKAHDLKTPLSAGERLIFELVGKPTRTVELISTSPQARGRSGRTDVLPIALATAGVLIIGLAGVLYLRQRRAVPAVAGGAPAPRLKSSTWQAPGPKADKQALAQAIAALDDAYEAGEFDEETYREERQDLVDRLVVLMDEEG